LFDLMLILTQKLVKPKVQPKKAINFFKIASHKTKFHESKNDTSRSIENVIVVFIYV